MNTFNKYKIPVQGLPSGDDLYIRVIDVEGPEKGPKCYIQASMHGAEHQGNAVLYQLLNYLESNDIKGSIRIIPTANPLAINTKMGPYTFGRFNAGTGDNWNRSYYNFTENNEKVHLFAKQHLNSSESIINVEYKKLMEDLLIDQIAESKYGSSQNGHLHLILQQLAINADYVLDLHTAGVATRYLYAPEYLAERSSALPFPFHLIIGDKFGGSMDEAAFITWVNLRNIFSDLGRVFNIDFESYTLELGGEERISIEEASKDLEYILEYLSHKGLTRNSETKSEYKIIKCNKKDYKSYFAKQAGLYDFIAKPGQLIKKGDLLAIGINFENYFSEESIKYEVLANEDCIVLTHYPSSSVMQGTEIYQVMEKFY